MKEKKWEFFKHNHRVGIHHNSGIPSINIEYYWFKKADTLRLELELGGSEETIMFVIGIPFIIKAYISINFGVIKWLSRILNAGTTDKYISRRTGLSIDVPFMNKYWMDNSYINLVLWKRDDGWAKGELNGYQFIKTWGDVLQGDIEDKEENTEEVVMVERIIPKSLNLPDNTPVQIKVCKVRWVMYHQRWYMKRFDKKYYRYEISCDQEIKVPGKGENSWDCEDEIIDNMSIGSANSIEEAVDMFVNEISRCMRR